MSVFWIVVATVFAVVALALLALLWIVAEAAHGFRDEAQKLSKTVSSLRKCLQEAQDDTESIAKEKRRLEAQLTQRINELEAFNMTAAQQLKELSESIERSRLL